MYVLNANSHQKTTAQQTACRGDGCQNEDPNKTDMVNICDDIDDRNIFDLFK